MFILIGSLIQLPLIFKIEEYFVKIGILFSYLIFSLCFLSSNEKKNFFYKIILIGYIFVCLILDFNNVFKNYIANIKFSKDNVNFGFGFIINIIDKILIINEKFPFLFLMCFSVINSFFTQLMYFILLIFA